jgi:hypothetical protein
MGKIDFIPRRDVDFHEWQGNLLVHVNLEAGRWGIPPRALEKLEGPGERWKEAFKVAMDPATRTHATVVEKQEVRKEFEAVLRPFIKGRLAYNELVSDADRKEMGLPVHDKKPTPVGPVKSRPELEVKRFELDEHRIVARDSVTKGTGKPAGVAGFEVWRKVGGEPPASDEEWRLVVQAPRSPHKLAYPQSDEGKRVYYRARWVNTRGVPGPWSEMKSAIIH